MPAAFITTPREVADDIARTLVEERLAACVNRVPCRSTYRWDGAVQEDAETILLAKTTNDKYAALRDRFWKSPCMTSRASNGSMRTARPTTLPIGASG